MSELSDEDDVPTLSVETFKALQEFYMEQEKKENELKSVLENVEDYGSVAFDENWQLSQFWYDEITVDVLSSEISAIVGENSKIALISCPTLYKQVKRKCENCEVILFEYDKRFAAFGIDYHYYDYKSPLDVPRTFATYFDVVVADPPFLSEDCLTKTAVTIKFLSKDKIILCTGAVMSDLIERLLKVKKSKFRPKHKNNLANEFLCFTNYDDNFKE